MNMNYNMLYEINYDIKNNIKSKNKNKLKEESNKPDNNVQTLTELKEESNKPDNNIQTLTELKEESNKPDNNIQTLTEEYENKLKYILDPLSVIIKLFILSKKGVGTKLSVYNNVLYIQEVGIFQSLVRYVFRDTKIDIQYLYNPIELASIKYLDKEFIKKYPLINNLFTNAQKGLRKLTETYSEYIFINHSLYLYDNIISNHLGENYNKNLFVKDNFTALYSEDIMTKIKSIWSDERIKILLNMIEFIDNANSSNDSIKCLEDFMISIDREVENILCLKIISLHCHSVK